MLPDAETIRALTVLILSNARNHDLVNRLTVVRGYRQLLDMCPTDPIYQAKLQETAVELVRAIQDNHLISQDDAERMLQ